MKTNTSSNYHVNARDIFYSLSKKNYFVQFFISIFIEFHIFTNIYLVHFLFLLFLYMGGIDFCTVLLKEH